MPTIDKYPGHVLRKLRAERGVGRPPRPQPHIVKEEPVIGPTILQKIARRRGIRLTDNQCGALASLYRFGNMMGYPPATVRSLGDRGLISPKTGKITKKGREILEAAKFALED